MAKSKGTSEPFDAYTNLVRPASEDLKSTLRALIQPELMNKPGKMAAPDPAQPRSLFRIDAVRTMNQNGVRSVFSWNEDPLALVIDISVAEGPLDSGIRFDANFQLVDHATNNVRKDIWSRGLRPQPGRNFSVCQGNNWDMTPQRWGLCVGLYLFRAILEIEQLDFFCSSEGGSLFRVR
jgi:hypothetical protein